MLEYLETQKASGLTNLTRGLNNYSRHPGRAGLAILISDLFSPTGFLEGLRDLQKFGHEVILIQVNSPEELKPAYTGDIKLIDRETREIQEVTITPGLMRLYQERLETWQREIKRECDARGIHYFHLATDQPWDKFILRELRRQGLVR